MKDIEKLLKEAAEEFRLNFKSDEMYEKILKRINAQDKNKENNDNTKKDE